MTEGVTISGTAPPQHLGEPEHNCAGVAGSDLIGAGAGPPSELLGLPHAMSNEQHEQHCGHRHREGKKDLVARLTSLAQEPIGPVVAQTLRALERQRVVTLSTRERASGGSVRLSPYVPVIHHGVRRTEPPPKSPSAKLAPISGFLSRCNLRRSSSGSSNIVPEAFCGDGAVRFMSLSFSVRSAPRFSEPRKHAVAVRTSTPHALCERASDEQGDPPAGHSDWLNLSRLLVRSTTADFSRNTPVPALDSLQLERSRKTIEEFWMQSGMEPAQLCARKTQVKGMTDCKSQAAANQ